jgi:hypothetical protein
VTIEVCEESLDWLTVDVPMNQGFDETLGSDAG